MNVKTLIEKLQALDPGAMVVKEAGGEWHGFEELDDGPAAVTLQIDQTNVRCQAKGKFYMGSTYEESANGTIKAVCIA